MDPKAGVLCYLTKMHRQRFHVALAEKLRGKYGGLMCGYCGCLLSREDPAKAAIYHLREHCSIEVDRSLLSKMAVIDIYAEDNAWLHLIHVYLCRSWNGTPCKSAEMGEVQWFLPEELPFEKMMPTDCLFLPRILDNEKVRCRFRLTKDQKGLKGSEIQTVSDI